jgi:hypothetical protein
MENINDRIRRTLLSLERAVARQYPGPYDAERAIRESDEEVARGQ